MHRIRVMPLCSLVVIKTDQKLCLMLMQVDLPLGMDMVPDAEVVKRAQQEDLNNTIQYQVGTAHRGTSCELGPKFTDVWLRSSTCLGHPIRNGTE
jgi:hypothetical protein